MKGLKYIICAVIVCAACVQVSAIKPITKKTIPTLKIERMRLRNDSIHKAQTDSIARVVADSIAKVQADSIARVQADSIARIVADSIAKAKADSIAKAKADSIAKAKADSIAKEQAKPKWSSCTIRGLKLKGTIGSQSMTVTCNTQAIWDSIIVISVYPLSLLPIEIYHVEATPTEVLLIDRVKKTYTRTTYSELNQYVRPKLTYKDLQAMASAELPASAKNGVISYSVGDDTAVLNFTYPTPAFNQMVGINRADLKNYKKVDLKKFL